MKYKPIQTCGDVRYERTRLELNFVLSLPTNLHRLRDCYVTLQVPKYCLRKRNISMLHNRNRRLDLAMYVKPLIE